MRAYVRMKQRRVDVLCIWQFIEPEHDVLCSGSIGNMSEARWHVQTICYRLQSASPLEINFTKALLPCVVFFFMLRLLNTLDMIAIGPNDRNNFVVLLVDEYSYHE